MCPACGGRVRPNWAELEEHILHHSDSEAEIFFACLERWHKTVAAKQVSPEKITSQIEKISS